MIKSKILKMIWGIIATISIAALSFLVLPSVWFWICWEILSAGFVAVGCAGEWYLFVRHESEDDKKPGDRRMELQFISAVAIGVFMEFLALTHIIPETIRLERDVGDSKLKAAQLESTNLVLRSNVVTLEMRLLPRTISADKRRLFINLLRDAPKGNVRIAVRNLPQETVGFTQDIADMLEAAGYSVTNGVERVANFITVKKPPSLSIIVSKKEDRPAFSDRMVYAFSVAIDPAIETHEAPTNIITLDVKSNELVLFVNEKEY